MQMICLIFCFFSDKKLLVQTGADNVFLQQGKGGPVFETQVMALKPVFSSKAFHKYSFLLAVSLPAENNNAFWNSSDLKLHLKHSYTLASFQEVSFFPLFSPSSITAIPLGAAPVQKESYFFRSDFSGYFPRSVDLAGLFWNLQVWWYY